MSDDGRDGGENPPPRYGVILFYTYKSIRDPPALLASLSSLCQDENCASGRLLIAAEGVNGTLALPLGNETERDGEDEDEWREAQLSAFERAIVRVIGSFGEGGEGEEFDIDFKRSWSVFDPFIDWYAKVVRELVGWGLQIPPPRPNGPKNIYHLKPQLFHDMLISDMKQDEEEGGFVLVDVRNAQESALGHFRNAILPPSRNMHELGNFLEKELGTLRNRKIMMYCTGGIRCEKASLYLNKITEGSNHIYQLHGGIHEYLVKYGGREESQFIGKNFVFDKRVYCGEGRPIISSPQGSEHHQSEEERNLGKCQECHISEAELTGCAVCCVCRWQLLVCRSCLLKRNGEIFCQDHGYLDGLYSYSLYERMETNELVRRRQGLQRMESDFLALKRKGKNKRRMIRAAMARIEDILAARPEETWKPDETWKPICRNSGKSIIGLPDSLDPIACTGDCWGFFGRRGENGTTKCCS